MDRLNDSLAYLGEDRGMGKWKFVNLNHIITMVMPIRIGLVEGGNHSRTAGILTGEGKVQISQFIDLSKIYPHIYCDGKFYYLSENNKKISEVKNKEFAAIFEIGRIIWQKTDNEKSSLN